ncbi:MAG: glycosyltransferase family 4 protein [Cyanobacteria bacterium]|nr:glycosyltransferase family 4 protein [Cyanobacteriota bacterium]
MKITLVPDLPAYGSLSMARYHAELGEAIRRHADSEIHIEDIKFPKHCYGYSSLSNRLIKRWILRLDRWVTYPALVSLCKSDLFHILDQSYGHLAGHSRGTKTVITCHDLIPLRHFRGELCLDYGSVRKDIYLKILEGLRLADHVIAISQATKDDLQNLLGIDQKKITVVHNCTSKVFSHSVVPGQPSQKPLLRSALGLPERGHLVLHVGTCAPYKNTAAILRALQLLREKEIWFVRVGAPLTSENWREATRLGVADRVIYTNWVPDEILAQYYQACDVLVFPSLWEGFGLPPLEAMSCGLPVVVSCIPALQEVVGEAGLQVKPEDHVALSEAIKSVLSDEELRERLVLSGLRQAEKFDWDEAARATLSVYKRTVTGNT